MSENQKENQNTNLNVDSFDDEDDLWAIQGDTSNSPTIDFDGFDEEDKQGATPPQSSVDITNIENEQEKVIEQIDQPKAIDTQEPEPKSEPEGVETPSTSVEPLEPLKPLEPLQPINKVESTLPTDNDEQKDDMASSLDELEMSLSDQTPENQPVGDSSPSSIEDEVTPIKQESEIISPMETIETIETIDTAEETSVIQTQPMTIEPEDTQITKTSKPAIVPNAALQENLNQLVANSLKDLEQKRANLEETIAKLERRRDKIQQEMNTTFAGASQNLAIRVQGFKDYLVGSLQDLVIAAEQIELDSSANDDDWETDTPVQKQVASEPQSSAPQFAGQNFTDERKEIRRLLDQYRLNPDYYGPAWQLRRTFEPIHAKQVADWFFNQGGRGSLPSMGSRLQNILIGSAIISVLSHLYGDRNRILILADTPEKLGEWRRGLQDCLGISRSDFGPNRGVILFETSSALIKKGDRIMEDDDLPLVIMDLDDDRVSLSLLKFPLWLAFAPDSPRQSDEYYY